MTECTKWKDTKLEVECVLGPEYISRLNHLKKLMRDFWKGRAYQGYFTLHDSSHSAGVECALYKLIPLQMGVIPLNGTSTLNQEDWFHLIAAAWLHDVGMSPSILRNDSIIGETLDELDIARKNHHLRSKQYIKENYIMLGLNEAERDNLGIICEYHRKSVDIYKCPRSFDIDLRLLSAYLRLADGIHINHERINDNLFALFDLIGMPEKSRIHWMKSKLTYDVFPDPENLTINIALRFSNIDMIDSKLVSDSIRNEIRSELYTVRDILIRGGISYYLDVDITESEIPADANLKTLLQQMINNIQLDTWASASDVANSLISSILYLYTLDDKKKALEILRKYQERIIKKNVETRTCHVILDKISNMINISIGASGSVDSELIFENLKDEILVIKKEREEAFNKIAENAKPILIDGEPILLFGHSKIVLKALALLENDVKKNTEIYVCEGRNSGRYSYLNEFEYCDGLEYARAVKDLGFDQVSLVPDILVGNLFERTQNKIQKILFGANGIDINEASFGHTAGHLTIAKLARAYNVPVYVLADCYKFGELKYNEKIERENMWLMGEGSSSYSKLKDIRIFNPREDKVGYENISYLITEHGMFPPHKMPKAIKSKYYRYQEKYCSQ